MKEARSGLMYEVEDLVTKDKSARSMGSGTLEVYATPSMVALMEKSSMLCVAPFLDKDETTVGGSVNVRHIRPTALGSKVICKSRIKEVKGKKIEFEVEVFERGKLIGNGGHVRFVVHKETFLKGL